MTALTSSGLTISAGQRAVFAADGFVALDQIIEPGLAAALAECYADLFDGRFETGLQPDEWNWKPGRDSADRTRQICNAWKSDRLIASVVLSEVMRRTTTTRSCTKQPARPGSVS